MGTVGGLFECFEVADVPHRACLGQAVEQISGADDGDASAVHKYRTAGVRVACDVGIDSLGVGGGVDRQDSSFGGVLKARWVQPIDPCIGDSLAHVHCEGRFREFLEPGGELLELGGG